MKDYNIRALCPVSIFKSCLLTFTVSGIFVGFAVAGRSDEGNALRKGRYRSI